MSDVYHLELRQFPHVTRVFNLDRAELDGRFVVPWIRGALIDHDERRWAPDKTRLKVMAGPPLRPDELGLGRGWGTVTQESQDVTAAVIAAARRGADARPEVQALKQRVVQRAARPIDLRAVVALAGAAHPGWRVSEQVSAAEQAVWELLHEGELTMLAEGDEVPSERWQDLVLSFSTWAPADGADPVLIHARANGRG